MSYKVTSKATYAKKIKQALQSLHTYRPEFDMMIDTLALIYEKRDENMKRWEELDNFAPVMEYTNKAGATNLSKHPCFLNNLQYHEQILKYEKSLGLTPMDAKKMNIVLEEEEDVLAQFKS